MTRANYNYLVAAVVLLSSGVAGAGAVTTRGHHRTSWFTAHTRSHITTRRSVPTTTAAPAAVTTTTAPPAPPVTISLPTIPTPVPVPDPSPLPVCVGAPMLS